MSTTFFIIIIMLDLLLFYGMFYIEVETTLNLQIRLLILITIRIAFQEAHQVRNTGTQKMFSCIGLMRHHI